MSGFVSRGHLLRALAANRRESAVDVLVAEALGFERTEASQEPSESVKPSAPPQNNDSGDLLLQRARNQRSFWSVTAIQKRLAIEPITAVPLTSKIPIDTVPPPFPYPPAWSVGRVFNVCHDLLQLSRAGRRIDEKKASEQVSQCRLFEALPHKQRMVMTGRVLVLQDFSPHLRPLWQDQRWLRTMFAAMLGEAAVDFFQSHTGPLGLWSDAKQRPLTAQRVRQSDQVLLVSDFGAMGSGVVSRDWRVLTGELNVLSALPCRLSLVPLVGASGRTLSLHQRTESKTSLLLCALSQVPWAEPAQLRLLCLAIGGSVSDELDVYNSDQVNRQGGHITLKSSVLPDWLKQFDTMPQAIRYRVTTTIDGWQKYLPESWREVESLQRNLLNSPRPQDYPRLKILAGCAEKTIESRQIDSNVQLMASVLPLAGMLADYTENEQWQVFLQQMTMIGKNLGAELPLIDLAESDHSKRLGLRERGADLIATSTLTHSDLLQLSHQAVCVETRKLVRDSSLPGTGRVRIVDGGNEYHLQKLNKPDWADRWWRGAEGLLNAAHPDGLIMQIKVRKKDPMVDCDWRLTPNGSSWASNAGTDHFGLWADLTVANVTQRMRWIAPGTFSMGSPESEHRRSDRETQHTVTLTTGYWLAETSCTQAFWAAAQGSNSERNSGLDEPKVDISWTDCQQWLEGLSQQIPGFSLRLPTEAEWEYACRAGTSTAHWWGDEFDDRYVNGNSAKISEKDLPANPWGLKSMSGNISEWCNDWYGAYQDGEVTDPAGPEIGQFRVVRGGRWFNDQHHLRSAFRSNQAPDRFGVIGLRLAGGADLQAGKEWATTADRALRSSDQRGVHGLRSGNALADQ